MKNNYWLILAILALLGMVFVPVKAHSTQLVSIPSRRAVLPTRINPATPALFPNRPVPGPSIGRRIELPAPAIPLPARPTALVGTVKIAEKDLPAPRGSAYLFLRKTLSGVDEKTPGAGTLGKIFDTGDAKEVPAVNVPTPSAGQAGKEEKPGKAGSSERFTLPESDLEREIGIR